MKKDIRDDITARRCVQTGVSGVECDHKNGRYNAPAQTESVDDFQPLSRTSNLAKREACKKCRATGLRFDPSRLGYPIPYLEGGEEFGDGDEEDPQGCGMLLLRHRTLYQ